jgi:hypothetical protein
MSKTVLMLFCGLILGLGWAIRGHFGHEWGASWAGAMGALAILVAAKRKDWLRRIPVLIALGGIGWAVGGMMSYGIVIGYCRGVDFINVAYGYTMLAVIGGLYGFIGGGFLGLGLESTNEKMPSWPRLLTEMVAGAYIVWGFIIYQLEWFMTPPRSELWAACGGGAAALAWYLYRKGFHRALRVAAYAAVGAGFGFSFGNFIQTLGSISGIAYNWWNVMEFTLGFCGGLGMAYAIATIDWPESVKPSKGANWLALVFVVFAIPMTNIIDGFEAKKFVQMAEQLNISNPMEYAQGQIILGWIIILIFTLAAIITWQRYQKQDENRIKWIISSLLFAYTLYYTIFGFIIKGFFHRAVSIKHSDTLYVPIIIVAFILWFISRKKDIVLPIGEPVSESWKRWGIIIIGVLIFIVIITLISINAHSGIAGFHERF